jgi:hypothetical protein
MKTNDTLIKQIGEVIDEKLAARLEPINNKLGILENKLGTVESNWG